MRRENDRNDRAPMSVLLVEDSTPVRQRLCELITEVPILHVAAEAATVAEAIACFNAFHPDAVLLDLALRGGSGMDVLQYIRSGVGNPSVVIVLSNYLEPETYHRCSELGADFLFNKSDEFELAIETLRALAGRETVASNDAGNAPGYQANPKSTRPTTKPVTLANRLVTDIEISHQGSKTSVWCSIGGLFLYAMYGVMVWALVLGYIYSTSSAQAEPDSRNPGTEPTLDVVQEELELTLRVLQEERLIRTETAMREHLSAQDAQQPTLAWSLNDAGLLMARKERLEIAQLLFEQALEIITANFEPAHPARATLLQNLGDVLLLRRDPRAADRYREAAIVVRTSAGPAHPRLASVLNGWATALASQGRRVEAEALYRRAIQIYTEPERYSPQGTMLRNPPPWGDSDPLDVIAPLHNLALLLLEAQRMEEAEALLKRAYRLLGRHGQQNVSQMIPVLRAMAKVQWALGNNDEAALCERVADNLESQRANNNTAAAQRR